MIRFSKSVSSFVTVSLIERIRAGCGALICVLIVAAIGILKFPNAAAPLLFAPLGASAVLLFAVPASPLAQPWAVLGGNTIAAVIGVTCALCIPVDGVAAAVALGTSIVVLLNLKCLHPPSGAVALTAVLGGPIIRDLGYWYVLWPVVTGSVALVLVAIIFNRMTGKDYPHVVSLHAPAVSSGTGGGLGVTADDLANAIRERDEVVSVDPGDLEDILQRAEVLAFARRSGGVVAADVMAQETASVKLDTHLKVVLDLLRTNRIKALPVIDDRSRVIGIVTQTDLLEKANWGPSLTGSSIGWRLRSIKSSDRPLRGKACDVMTTSVRCVLVTTPIAHIVQVMAETGHHHLPVVTPDGKLGGMVTQSDVVSALFRVNSAELALSA